MVLDWCCMCKHDGESVDHLLLHCLVAYEMWSMPFGLLVFFWLCLGVFWVYWNAGKVGLVGNGI